MRNQIKNILREAWRTELSKSESEKRKERDDFHEQNPDTCPECGSENIKSDPFEKVKIDGDDAILTRRCLEPDCGEVWEESWKYKKIADKNTKIRILRK